MPAPQPSSVSFFRPFHFKCNPFHLDICSNQIQTLSPQACYSSLLRCEVAVRKALLIRNWTLLSAFFLFVLNAAALAQSTACFTEVDSPAGMTPEGLAVGDFNHDGKLDASVIGSSSSRTMISMMGSGDGHLVKQVKYLSILPRDVAVADMNGDGNLDVVVANEVPQLNAGQVKVFLGNGDGTFRLGTIAQVTDNVERVALADFNHDGKLDAIIETGVFAGTDRVQLLLGNGDGTLQPPVSEYILPNYPEALAVADLNADGKSDVLTLTENSTGVGLVLSVLLGNGDGTFQPATQYTNGSNANTSAIATGDFNGDGILDVALAANQFELWYGTGGGNLAAPINITAQVTGYIATADLTGSGRLDLVALGGGGIAVLFNSGGGTFQTPQSVHARHAAFQIVPGDFNNDGKPDLALTFFQNGQVGVLLNCSTSAAHPGS